MCLVGELLSLGAEGLEAGLPVVLRQTRGKVRWMEEEDLSEGR